MASNKKFDLEGFSVDSSNNIVTTGSISTTGSITAGDVEINGNGTLSTTDEMIINPSDNFTIQTNASTVVFDNSGEKSDIDWDGSLFKDIGNAEFDGTIIFSALPTSDPVVAGQLWNDSGTLKVSAGS